ncbi:MAG TPA: hypothetical protein VGB98_09130 [Pyrinomonadaceae bacterium]|jgi:hypothetical protein
MVNLEEYKNRFSESGQRVLELAFDKARQKGQNHITVDHILNALALEETFLFDMTMRNWSLDPGLVRATLKRRLDAGPHHDGEGVKVGQDAIELFKGSMAHAKEQGRDAIEVIDMFATLAQHDNLFPELISAPQPNPQVENVEAPFGSREPDFQRGAWLRVLALMVILLGVIDVSVFLLRRKFQAINESVRSPSYSTQALKLPEFDPVLDAIHRQGLYHDFKYSGRNSSSAVLAVRKKEFRAKDLLAANEYESLYCFLHKMRMEGRLEDEFDTLKSWVERAPAEKPFSWWQQGYFLSYIYETYLEPAGQSLKNSQYGRARWLAIEAAKRVRMVNMRASSNPELRNGYNQVLLTEALLWQPKVSFGHPREIGILFDIVDSDFDKSHFEELSKLAVDPDIAPLRSYWLGVYEFRSKNLPAALDYFKAASGVHENPKLKNLALLMQARCLFWIQNNTDTNSNATGGTVPNNLNSAATIQRLEELMPGIDETSYRDAVQYYIEELKRSRA